MNRFVNLVFKNAYVFLLIFLIIINLTPILAPVFAYFQLNSLSLTIYQIYSFFCHQLEWRSLFIFDFQYAWCVRDTFTWMSMLFIALYNFFIPIKAIKWYFVIPFVLPFVLDGSIQTIATLVGFSSAEPFYISNNFLRMITGTLFGIGLGLFLFPRLKSAIDEI